MDQGNINSVLSLLTLALSLWLHTQLRPIRRWKDRKEREAIKIIVLDDNADDLEMIDTWVLGKFTNRSEVYTSVSKFKKKMPDTPTVVIFDHYLNAESGSDILEFIQSKNKCNAAISFTGAENPSVLSNYVNREKPIDAYVSKHDKDKYKLLEKAINDGIKKCFTK